MTPDQNPHPLTDHHARAPRGETPMPLVDDVALHQPALAAPPPLFRPKAEAAEREPSGEAVPSPVPEPSRVPVPSPVPGPGVSAGPGPDASPTAGPGTPPESAPLDDPGRSLHLEPGSPHVRRVSPESLKHAESASSVSGVRGPLGRGFRPQTPDGLEARDTQTDKGTATGIDTAPCTGAAPGPDIELDRVPGLAPETAPETGTVPAPGPGLNRVPGLAPDTVPGTAPVPDLTPGTGTAPRPELDRVPDLAPDTGLVPDTGTARAPVPDAELDRVLAPVPDTELDRVLAPTPAPAPDAELDLVLDLAPGARAASATLSVPAPQPPPRPRRHTVIANESTAAIPVHLLFRDDPEQAEPAAVPTAVARPTTGTTPADRTPRPRSPHPRVEPPTRPAPLADPRLVERPGPALPGYAALLAGAAGLLGVLALLWWCGALPAAAPGAVGLAPRPYEGIGVAVWAGLALLVTVVVLALGGLGRGRVGHAWVLTLFGDYRGSVRRTGLVWVSPLLLRRRVDVRLRHWRSEPLPAVDATGTALRVVVLVVWRIKDTVRAALGIEDHEAYLSAQVESAMARVLSQLPADAFHEDAPTLRNAEAVGDALTRMLKADCEPVGVEVYSAQPTGIEYAPEVAAAMQRRRIAAIDARHRDSVLTSVVDAVDDTVNRLTTRGIVDLDDYERKALVKDLTVAFYASRSSGGESA
ncbi:SPFH domain-containing protein [Streptomyces sp. NPDC088755]|uniref:SPFH domain-containing protein n=1 Tax=Streptomyces sp. NPDC088755 TaxID=3365888 RepID=UPI003823923A